MTGTTVLVTGGTGFLATRCVAQALRAGHRVRTTVRSARREDDVRAAVAAAGADAGDALSFVTADLTSDDGWQRAVAGCTYVLHVASPFPPAQPEHEDELIVPAREGTLRVLRAARDAAVRRVVVTSSFAAVGYGHPDTERPFTEDDWTDVTADISPYVKSKALAERAAWDFAGDTDGGPELTVVNPVGIFGPVLGPDHASSIDLIRSLLDGNLPGTPRLHFAVVDVRDAADLHLRAMTSPQAAGRRFIAAAGDAVSLHDIALVLRERLGDAASRVPAEDLPDDVVRRLAETVPAMREVAAGLGRVRHVDGSLARRVLGWAPRSTADAVTATAESLLALGLAGDAAPRP
ncbi:NAD-dependent epimerase/dehydratase family protein [Streptomyces sp. NPDC026672]|uniref:NAD-dependent epimerase/dehydratase family protein n=1 Tax=unclassified Streptomyces TaxID=2593676 RepID=UPI0033E92883